MCLLCIGYDYPAFMDYMDPDVPKKADKLNLSLSFARAVLYAALLFPLSTTRVAVIVDWAHSVVAWYLLWFHPSCFEPCLQAIPGSVLIWSVLDTNGGLC